MELQGSEAVGDVSGRGRRVAPSRALIAAAADIHYASYFGLVFMSFGISALFLSLILLYCEFS